jgi:hypothetical protein
MAAHLDSFRCEHCYRRYVAVTERRAASETEQRALCVCGGKLRAVILDIGYYEAVPRPLDIAPSKPAPEPEPMLAPPAPEKQETDLGYGKSHGYGPSHGGPTGPGDAPAGETDGNVRK